MYTPESKYQRRADAYGKKLDIYAGRSNSIGNYKLLVFFAGAALAVILYIMRQYIVMAAVLAIFAAGFVYLSIIHNRIIKNRNYSQAMLQINNMCLKRAKGLWTSFSDTGEEFVDPGHNYTHDLDLFGKGSLFQMINMTTTYSGRQKLAGMFLQPLDKTEDIAMRQEAVAELAEKLTFRHRMYSNVLMSNKDIILTDAEVQGKKHTKSLIDIIDKLDAVFAWAKDTNSRYSASGFKLLITALPVITLLLTVLAVLKLVPFYLPIAGFVIQFLMLGYKVNYRNKSFELVEKYSNTLKVYRSVLKQFEAESFESRHLMNLREQLKGVSHEPAWKQIERLSKLWELIANRYNFLYTVINTVTLWDFHCLVALEKWKMTSGRYVEKWFDIIGEVEALSSLAVMRHDNPDFIMPRVSEELKGGIVAEQLGHPLLTKGRKCNDINIDRGQPILLITGSNMSGKSTFLRTVGLSLILSYMGLPVCAKAFSCPVMKVYACMRTSDNLGQSVSSFYAELLRVKLIVEAVDREERVFFLLDEIFKGTNSADRHTGARMLISQLDRKGAWGMVSTHDLELADMERESGRRIRNYHFKEYYRDNSIHFDYQLREGVSDTRNAIFLMKMAGVKVEEE
ncbi:MutS-related protein [Ruminiclostridium cellobioparum]|uniref:Mismatch repair ATPase (MutS family) n=1 Tax=Ruminiclostridium cellobioparum subsp. termitidis CT1112 TaxID=1195236 RepID=S0FIQ9_RUMCE|nr:MutS family DNA mismatch repair protein [Ruminiclostridium cellobioparum]EMS71587.1 Mismatch repair ATPase (MutS family) [Ruminiclostridium cellobioparum subsp. termitidis CT1112]